MRKKAPDVPGLPVSHMEEKDLEGSVSRPFDCIPKHRSLKAVAKRVWAAQAEAGGRAGRSRQGFRHHRLHSERAAAERLRGTGSLRGFALIERRALAACMRPKLARAVNSRMSAFMAGIERTCRGHRKKGRHDPLQTSAAFRWDAGPCDRTPRSSQLCSLGHIAKRSNPNCQNILGRQLEHIR